MNRRTVLAVAGVSAVAASAVTSVAVGELEIGKDGVRGVKTARPSQMAPVAPGVRFVPILSAGDGDGRSNFQLSGIPDGLGAYASSKSTLELYVNHELGGTAPAAVGARVSRLTIDRKTLRVMRGRHIVNGSEGYQRFCSGTLSMLDDQPWYFTGEESVNYAEGTAAGGRGGSSIAVEAKTGKVTETRHFGLFAHENVTPLHGLSKKVFLSGEDGAAGTSNLYAFSADSWRGGIAGQGQLMVWKPDAAVADGNPSTNDIAKGGTMAGTFVPLSQAQNADAKTLEAETQALGAFDFVRVEDTAVRAAEPGVVYLADTGAARSETTRGRIYRFVVDKANPSKATLSVLLDGDAGDDLVNPDNLDLSKTSLMIQEDRNAEHRFDRDMGDRTGYSRLLQYDLERQTTRVVARVATPPELAARAGEGVWESSGIIDAAELIGPGWWLLDVQAHDAVVLQPGADVRPNSALGEDGQILAMYVPNS